MKYLSLTLYCKLFWKEHELENINNVKNPDDDVETLQKKKNERTIKEIVS